MTKMTVKETKTYAGLLCEHEWGDAYDILFLSVHSEPLGELLNDDIARKRVSVRYWITDKQVTRDEAQEAFIKQLYGVADCQFGSHYSDITGYLWTDEECKVGGHDLLEELHSHVGKWLILEVDIHD